MRGSYIESYLQAEQRPQRTVSILETIRSEERVFSTPFQCWDETQTNTFLNNTVERSLSSNPRSNMIRNKALLGYLEWIALNNLPSPDGTPFTQRQFVMHPFYQYVASTTPQPDEDEALSIDKFSKQYFFSQDEFVRYVNAVAPPACIEQEQAEIVPMELFPRVNNSIACCLVLFWLGLTPEECNDLKTADIQFTPSLDDARIRPTSAVIHLPGRTVSVSDSTFLDVLRLQAQMRQEILETCKGVFRVMDHLAVDEAYLLRTIAMGHRRKDGSSSSIYRLSVLSRGFTGSRQLANQMNKLPLQDPLRSKIPSPVRITMSSIFWHKQNEIPMPDGSQPNITGYTKPLYVQWLAVAAAQSQDTQ